MYTLRIPRHACSPRDVARAGDLWRLVQEAAVAHSTDCGWPPARYRAEGNGFVVREMTALHPREARYDETLEATTWIAESRRGLLLRRETRLGAAMIASVEWVHIGPSGAPVRAPPGLASAFPLAPSPAPEFPAVPEGTGTPLPPFRLTPFWTEMDPLGHVNHPRYVDWADEALAVHVAAQGGDPIAIVPVAERLRFRGSAKAGDAVEVRLSALGAGAYDVWMGVGEETVCTGTLVRTSTRATDRQPGGWVG